MTENNYSIFDDVTMPEYLKDKNLPGHYYCLLYTSDAADE